MRQQHLLDDLRPCQAVAGFILHDDLVVHDREIIGVEIRDALGEERHTEMLVRFSGHGPAGIPRGQPFAFLNSDWPGPMAVGSGFRGSVKLCKPTAGQLKVRNN